jgi:ABC-2 type transport system permease protein
VKPGFTIRLKKSKFFEGRQGAIIGALLPLAESIILTWPHLTGLIAVTVLLFALASVMFQRQEIRA